MAPPPSPRILTRAWLVLMALTVTATAAGLSAAPAETLGYGGVALVLAVSWFKSGQVLMNYLNLRSAPAGWRGLFQAYLLIIGLLIFALYAAARLRLGIA